MTVEVVFIILGALAMAVSLFEIIGHLFGGLSTLRAFTGRILGRGSEQQSGMDEAGAWVQALIIMVVGCAMLAAGVSTMWS